MTPSISLFISLFVLCFLCFTSSASPLVARHDNDHVCYPDLDGKDLSIVHGAVEWGFEQGAFFEAHVDNVDATLSNPEFRFKLAHDSENAYIIESLEGPPWVISTAGPSGFFTLVEKIPGNLSQQFYITCQKCHGHSKRTNEPNEPLASGCVIVPAASVQFNRCVATTGETNSTPFVTTCDGGDAQKWDFWRRA